MELRHLRYFAAVASELHFGRAALRLHIVQPALSKQIAALERELGVQLLERSKRRVSLTEAGHPFLEEVTDILSRVDRAARIAQLAAQGQLGRLTIGFIGPAVESVLPEILLEFRTRFPGVNLTLEEMTSADQVRALHDGTIDVALVRLPLDDRGIELREILAEPIIAALPKTHPLASKRTLEMGSLADESFVAIPRDREPGLRDLCVAACRQAGFNPTIAQEALNIHVLLGLVAGGLGVALVPSSVQNLNRTGVVYRPLRDVDATLRLAIGRPRGRVDATTSRFVELVEELAPTLHADTQPSAGNQR